MSAYIWTIHAAHTHNPRILEPKTVVLKYSLSFGVRMSAIECRLSSDLICDAFSESFRIELAVAFTAKFSAISAAENPCGKWWSLLWGSWILKVLSSCKYNLDLNNTHEQYSFFRWISFAHQSPTMLLRQFGWEEEVVLSVWDLKMVNSQHTKRHT